MVHMVRFWSLHNLPYPLLVMVVTTCRAPDWCRKLCLEVGNIRLPPIYRGKNYVINRPGEAGAVLQSPP